MTTEDNEKYEIIGIKRMLQENRHHYIIVYKNVLTSVNKI